MIPKVVLMVAIMKIQRRNLKDQEIVSLLNNAWLSVGRSVVLMATKTCPDAEYGVNVYLDSNGKCFNFLSVF